MTAQITFDVADQDIDLADIQIDVEGVVDQATMTAQGDYTPNASDFSIDTVSAAVRIQTASITQNEGSPSGSTAYTFTLTRTGGPNNLQVDYQVAGSGVEAANADDFTGGAFPSGTATFNGSTTTTQVTINVAQDTLVEATELFSITLVDNASVVLTNASTTGEITNDDSANLAIGNATLNEGDSLTTAFVFDVTLTAAVDTDLTINYQSADNTALAASDYTAVNSSLTILSGATSGQITVNVTGDQLVELDEQFFVDLSGLSVGGRNVTLTGAQGTGTVTNDDSANLTIGNATA